MIYESQSKAAPPTSGITLSRDQAMAAFEAAWRCVQGDLASPEPKQCPQVNRQL